MDPEILQLFHLNPATGELSALKVLDYEGFSESDPVYTFTVEAVDPGGTMPPGLASVTVRITVGVGLSGSVLPKTKDGGTTCVFILSSKILS